MAEAGNFASAIVAVEDKTAETKSSAGYLGIVGGSRAFRNMRKIKYIVFTDQ